MTERELIKLAQGGDDNATIILVNQNMKLMKRNLQKYQYCESSTFEDLLQESIIGFINGIRKFDLKKPHRLSTFAMFKVWSRLTCYMKAKDRIVRNSDTFQFLLESRESFNFVYYTDESYKIVDRRVDTIEDRDEIVNMIAKMRMLPPHQYNLLKQLFWEGLTLNDVMTTEHRTFNTVKQNKIEALEALKCSLN